MEALMVGISGLRGTIGGTLTPAVIMQMASAVAAFLKQSPAAEDAGRLKDLFEKQASSYVRVQELSAVVKNPDTHALHVKRVLDRVDNLGISTKRYKVVLDSVNGAGCVATATMLNKLGCQLI